MQLALNLYAFAAITVQGLRRQSADVYDGDADTID